MYNLESKVGRILYPGQTKEEQQLNRLLLCDYDYNKYVEGLTGFAGQNLQNIAKIQESKAVRTRVGIRGHYKAALTKLKDNSLVCCPCVAVRGEGPYDVEFFIYVYKSTDNGKNWVKINKTELMGKEPAMITCPDGTLVMTAQPIVDGEMGYNLPVYRSEDGGTTWETNYISGNRDYPRNLFLDNDGSICFMRCAGVLFEFEDNAKNKADPRIEICRSYDNGKTFEVSYGDITDWDYAGFMEISSNRLENGSLIASLRHQPSGTKGEGFENTLLTRSTDNGVTWSKPEVISRTGEVHFHITKLSNGKLLGTYSNYHVPFGVCAVLSEDNGLTWDYKSYYQLAISADYYVGWGTTIELPNGELLTCYASTPYLFEPPNSTVCETVKWNL